MGKKINIGGVTLVETLLVIVLVGTMSALTVPLIRDSANASKYEATREKMDALRLAILGTEAVDNTGRRTNYGFVGDWGSLPSTLSALTSAQVPAWTLDTAQGIGAGWRGPYASQSVEGAEGVTKDKWGFTFVYLPADAPPTLTSLGADNKAGGTQYDKDLVMVFNTAAWRSTVHAFVMEHATPKSGKSVDLTFPTSGALATKTAVSSATGAVTFNSIPYGLRAITVTGSPQIGPRQVAVETPYQVVSGGLLNYFNRSERVTYVPGSFSATGTGATVTIRLDNSYSTAKTVDFVTSWVDRQGTATEGFLKRIATGLIAQLISPGVASDSRVDVTANMVLPANSTNNTFELSFTTTAGGGTPINMGIARFSNLFEWVGSEDKDVVTFP